MGLLAKSTKGFGKLRVRGRRRVPKPPTNINAFMIDRIESDIMVDSIVQWMSSRLID